MTRFFSIMAALLVGSAAAYAQFDTELENATTQTVGAAWTTNTIWVGNTTSNNAMFVVDGGHVANDTTFIGNASGSSNNYLQVAGEDASLTTSGSLYVGNSGSSNKLTIANGGMVSSSNAFVGATNGASNNVAQVFGAGARWDVGGQLKIGSGDGNEVAVADGGTISAGALEVLAGSNGFYLAEGGTFDINNDFNAGMDGFNWNAGGHLIVASNLTGMAVSNDFNYLNGGRSLTLDGGTWATDTNKLVVGLGSAAGLGTTNGGWVFVGEVQTNLLSGGILVASTNHAELLVDNGSTVETTGGLYIGGSTNIQTGSVSVTNGGTIKVADLVINETSEFNLDDGGTLFVAGNYNADTQTNVNWNPGGQLSVGGTLTKSNGLDGTRRTLAIDGDGASWNLGSDLAVSGLSNNLWIINGGSVTNDDALVGTDAADSNNTVWVRGDGSLWKVDGSLNVGSSLTNEGNRVYVDLGGRIEADVLNIASNNSVTLENGGTLAMSGDFNLQDHQFLDWTIGGNLSVASNLTGMTSVSNSIIGETSYLGAARDLTLDGAGAQWTNGSDNLIVGYNSSYSDLVITNGATVRNANGYIGWGGNYTDNAVLVTGTNSTWMNSGGGLYVGVYGSSTNLSDAGGNNSLAVKNGAWVFVGEATTNAPGGGMLVASTNGAELVVGQGSVSIEETLYLGIASNSTATATIRGGGSVSVGDLEIAEGSHLDLMDGGSFAIDASFDVADRKTNGFNWGEGATLSVGGDLTGMDTLMTNGTDFALLAGRRDLTLDGGQHTNGLGWIVGLDESNSDLSLLNGATLVSDTAYIGYSSNANNNTIGLNGGSVWTNSGDVWVGYGGSTNMLLVWGGSTNQILNGSGYVGNTNTSSNVAWVQGSNSLLHVDQDLIIGSVSNGTGNTLVVEQSGLIRVDNDLVVNAGNQIEMASGGTIEVAGNMTIHSNSAIFGSGTNLLQGGTSTLAFNGSGIGVDPGIVFSAEGLGNTVAAADGRFVVEGSVSNQYLNFQTLELSGSELTGHGALEASTFGTVELTGGMINPFSSTNSMGTLVVEGELELNGGTLYTAKVTQAYHDLLVIEDPDGVDLSKLDLGVLVPNAVAGMTNTILVATNGTMFGGTEFASTNIVDGMLLFDAALVIDQAAGTAGILATNNATKFSSSLAYAGSEGIRAGYNGMKNAVFTRTKQLRRNLVSTAHSIPHEAYLMTNTNAPAGAQGPGDQNTIFDMHVWMQYFNGRGSYDAQGNSYGFDLNNGGTTIGADRLFGDALTVGFNYTYARSDSRTTNQDFLDTETYWLGAYGEWVGKSGLYVDAMAAYGFSSYDSVRVEDNYRGTAEYRGNDAGAYADVGQYYYYKNFALSPYAGLHFLTALAESHTETNEDPVHGGSQVHVDEFRRSWLESALGLKARHRFDTRAGRFQTTGYAEWTHDFLQEDIATTMSANGLPSVDMARISPDADVVNAGLGLSWILTDYMEIGVGYNGRFSERYEEHAGSLMFDIMF